MASNAKFYKRFDTPEEIINLGFINDGDLIIIAGKAKSLSADKY